MRVQSHTPAVPQSSRTFSVALLGDTIHAVRLPRAVERSQALTTLKIKTAHLSCPARNVIVVAFVRARYARTFLFDLYMTYISYFLNVKIYFKDLFVLLHRISLAQNRSSSQSGAHKRK